MGVGFLESYLGSLCSSETTFVCPVTNPKVEASRTLVKSLNVKQSDVVSFLLLCGGVKIGSISTWILDF